MKKVLYLLASIIVIVSCEKLNRHESPAGVISGSAQKGYLVKDSKVTAYAYGSNMKQTGQTFSASITGCLGAFSINVENADADYFELKAEGYYFDEVTGNITDSPICLSAFVASSEAKVNLNIFTTITKDRIMKLVSSGTSYKKAKVKAQEEFLKTVNLIGADIDFTKLDLTGGSDADALLLTTTCLIQNGRSASELSVVVEKAASEFKDNGKISEKTAEEIFQPQDLDFEIVFDNLRKYYEGNGLSKDDLPSYWRYFYLDENETMAFISHEGFNTSYTELKSPEAASGTYKIVSLEPFSVSTDVDWITFEKRELEKEVFELKVFIAENKAYEQRTGRLFLKDANSNLTIKNLTFSQGQAFPDIDPKISLKGEGVPGNPFLIECLDDLLYMRNVYNRTGDRYITSRTNASKVDASGAYFSLTSDIDLSPVCGPDKGDWIPIGIFQDGDYQYQISGFDGTFNCYKYDDGYPLAGSPGYTISGLYINNDKDYQGLFGIINGGTIRGLVIDGNVSGGRYVGLLAGYADNVLNNGFYNGDVVDIVTRGSVSGDSYAGGILGANGFGIKNCVNYADVTGHYCGGITSVSSSTIICCRNYGAITETTPYNTGFAGGIVGSLSLTDIWDCGNYGNVSGSYNIGGIVGDTQSQEVTWGDRASKHIINSYNNGDIRLILNNPNHNYKYHRAAGGIVGFVDGSFFSVENCYSSGTVSFEEGIENEYIGGICGEMWTSSSHIIGHNYWLQEGISAIGGERERNTSNIYGGNVIENCFCLTQAQMMGLEPYEGVLYKSKDGKSFNTLLESLNAYKKDSNPNGLYGQYIWEYSSKEPYPVLSESPYY